MSDAAPDPDHPVAAIFARIGGTTAVAAMIGVGQSTASEMKRRKSIPVRYWDQIIGKPDKAGRSITLADLHDAHRERGSAAAAPEPAAS